MGIFKKLGMVILMEPDLENAVTFYKKLGLELKFHVEGAWAEFSVGETKIGLCPTSKSEGLKRTGVVLEVDNVRELYQTLKAKNVEFLHEPVEKIHGIMVSFKDPGLNVIDLYQPTPEKVKELILKTATTEDGQKCCGNKSNCCGAEA